MGACPLFYSPREAAGEVTTHSAHQSIFCVSRLCRTVPSSHAPACDWTRRYRKCNKNSLVSSSTLKMLAKISVCNFLFIFITVFLQGFCSSGILISNYVLREKEKSHLELGVLDAQWEGGCWYTCLTLSCLWRDTG